MKDEIIKIKNITVRYGPNEALSDVSLTVNKGDYLAIIGPNGGGKSTLLKAILRLVAPQSGTIDVNSSNIGYVPQLSNADRSFPISVLEVVLTGYETGRTKLFRRYTDEQKAAAYEALKSVGLEKLSNRQVGALSGGEFQKMMLCRALISEPDILLLDEPTANIDPSSAKHIYTLLKELNQSKTIVMVTHDLFTVSRGITSLACLNKTLVYHGNPVLTQSTMDELYGCPVELIAHGVPHRVVSIHEESKR
jgi:zinc transport system ATP-binding protein